MENQEENNQNGNRNGAGISEEQAANINRHSGNQDGNDSNQSVDHNSSDEHMQIDEEGVETDADDQA